MPFTEKEMDSIDAANGFKVCVRAKPAIDRQSLEAAVAHVENYFKNGPAGITVEVRAHPNPAPGKNYGPQMATVLEAARKHLETLPKTKTEWRVWWVCQGGDYSAPCTDRADADKFVERIREIPSAQFAHVTGPHTVQS